MWYKVASAWCLCGVFGVREREDIGFFHYPLRPQIQKGAKPRFDEFHARGRAQVNFIKQR